MPVGSLAGRVTVGSGPGIHCSMLLALGMMDGYTGLLHMHITFLALLFCSVELMRQNYLGDMLIFHITSTYHPVILEYPFNDQVIKDFQIST